MINRKNLVTGPSVFYAPHIVHDWELIDSRSETIRRPFEPLQAKFRYERCIDCGVRRLEAEGQPTYLITDDSIEVAA
jgi:hypothetical protein